ncbi:hypothetical protein ACFV2Q_28020 [Streptomyces sp. NPDC059650]|uniref:hypothetical protein n=1 Tax=Streptomyces sp. NPDC059650 TaxID=3346896 RepID=UPI0036CF287C
MSDVSPEGFQFDGSLHEWKMGRMPESEQDWITEYRLRLQSDESSTRLWIRADDKAKDLASQLDELKEQNRQLAAEREQPGFHLGKRPETPEEIDAEVRFREIEQRWKVELADRKHRADLAFEQSGLIRRAEGVRGWALVAVVFAIIASPWVAMIAGIPAENFSLYLSPVTGIAGAIIGYWFGQGKQNEVRPPTIADSPVPPSRTSVP